MIQLDLFNYDKPRPMVDSRTIGIIAAKRNFDLEKERKYIEKAKTTKCRCHHWTRTSPCFYRTCRHLPANHYGVYLKEDLENEEVET